MFFKRSEIKNEVHFLPFPIGQNLLKKHIPRFFCLYALVRKKPPKPSFNAFTLCITFFQQFFYYMVNDVGFRLERYINEARQNLALISMQSGKKFLDLFMPDRT